MQMKKLFFLALVTAALSTQAQTGPKWMRYPAISPDGKTIVFTYKGDLYTVPSSGGNAIPLTMHEAHDFMPVWSPDGKHIAFASDRYGNFDIFLIPANGGEAKRLTYHSSTEFPYRFSNDGKQIYFSATRQDLASNRTFPTGSQPELYSVDINGGRVKQVLSTPAEDISLNAKGDLMLYHDKKGGENIWRKHHRSSITRDIWMYDMVNQKHTKITSFNGEDRSPLWMNDDKTLVYLSEETGSFNVHSISVSGGKSTPLTQFKKHPVRFLSKSQEGKLCFGYDGEIYTMTVGSKPQKITIQILADAKKNAENVVRVTSGAGGTLSPNGKELAFIYRGDVFVTAVDASTTKRITATPEMEVAVSWSPDGKTLLYGSERAGKWKIFETQKLRDEEPYFYAATLLKETELLPNNEQKTQPQYSPDGKELAFIANRNELKIYNFSTKQTRTILNQDHLFAWGENDQYIQWSPDSKWLLFDYAVPGSAAGEVGLVSADGKKIINLTQSGFNDYRPKWILGGKAMIWFSNRDGLRAAAMSGGAQADVYALFFSQEAWDKFKLSKDEMALLKELEEKKAKADTTNKINNDIVIDWQGLETRKTKLTIHSSSLADALVSKDGEMLYYLARFEKGYNLWSTNLRTKETKMILPLAAGSATLQWDKDQKSILLGADGSYTKIDPNSSKQDRITINGEMLVDGDAERAYLFNHVWRKTKNTFYTASFHGVNWDSYKGDYEAYLPHIGNNYEFSEMLSELLGELNVSHSGSSYGGFNPNGDATASLGVFYDFNYIGNGVRIVEVMTGGPLDKAGFNIQPGAIIEAIDGVTIDAQKDLAFYLNRKAGKSTLLKIVENGVARELVIKPITIGEENALLYQRWVKRNEAEVEKLSNGQLGYIHIPGMNDGAYRNTYEEVMGKYFNKKGIVVDTRFNGGGDLVADLAMFLSGKKFMDYTTDSRSNGYEPNFRWTKPSISIANEANYSDGHCYAFMVQDQKIGKLVGMPVPGTCTFAGWESLMDTGIRWGVPPVGVKAMNGMYLENWQTEPDVKVANEYEKVIKGVDQQLEVAVKELLKEIK